MQTHEMENEMIVDERQLKRSEEEIDAEFDQHNVDVEEILARTQRSFSSRRRHVQLYEAPEFVKRLNAFDEVQVGDTVIFECQWRAFPKPTIKWYKDDEEITEDARYNVEPDDNINGLIRLVVNGANKTDEGAYKCKAENQEGVASTTGYLSVAGAARDADKTLAAKKKEKKQQEKQKKSEQKQQQEQQQQQTEEEEDENEDPSLRKVQSDRNVSYPPHLRTIVEQKSLEEREAESLRHQPPSPIQEFIEKMQSGRGKGATWPYAVLGYQAGDFVGGDEEERCSDSDTSVESQDFERVSFSAQTDDDDVFTSSDSDITPSVQHKMKEQHQNISSALNQNNILADSQTNSVPRVKVCSTVRPIVCTNVTQRVPQIKGADVSNSGTVIPGGKTEPKLRQDVSVMSQPLDLGHMLDLIDSPWLYFLPITSSMTFVASATEMSPLLVVLVMAIISCVAFRFLFPDDCEET